LEVTGFCGVDAMTTDEILQDFDNQKSKFDAFAHMFEKLIVDLLQENSIRVHSVSWRVKSRQSLLQKMQSAAGTYENLSAVTDIVGLRIITYFEDEVDAVAKIVEKEFELDKNNSIDKRKILDPDRFGYLSLHYVCGLGVRRCVLPEYRRFGDFKCEIQIRSILQHTWAEIEHDLGYKTKLSVPYDMRRKFSRLAGLLELADSEFAGIRDAMRQYGREVPVQIETNPDTVPIDQTSLAAFIDNAPIVKQIDAEIVQALGGRSLVDPSNALLSFHVNGLWKCGLRTIADIQQHLQAARTELPTFVEYFFSASGSSIPKLFRGSSITALIQLRLVEKGDVETLMLLWREFGAKDSPEVKSLFEKLAQKYRDRRIS
jgi:putative GTP pyrophosphokinase